MYLYTILVDLKNFLNSQSEPLNIFISDLCNIGNTTQTTLMLLGNDFDI